MVSCFLQHQLCETVHANGILGGYHTQDIVGIALTPDGKLAFSTSRDESIIIREVATGRILRIYYPEGGLAGFAMLADGSLFLTYSDTGLALWETVNGKHVRDFPQPDGGLKTIAVTPDGQTALSAGAPEAITVWDISTGLVIRVFGEGHGSIAELKVTPDGRYAVSAHGNGALKLWEISTGTLIREFVGHSRPASGYRKGSLDITPDGQYLLSVDIDRTLRKWEIRTGREVWRAIDASYLWFVRVTPDGNHAITHGVEWLKVWDLAEGYTVRSVRIPGYFTEQYTAITPDGQFALCSSARHTTISGIVQSQVPQLWLIELATGRHAATYQFYLELDIDGEIVTVTEPNVELVPGLPLLHNAVLGGDGELVSQLLAAGAFPNARDGNEYTPLQYAAFQGDIEVVKWLMNRGARHDLVAKGPLPVDIAWHQNNLEVAKYLNVYSERDQFTEFWADVYQEILKEKAPSNLSWRGDGFQTSFSLGMALSGKVSNPQFMLELKYNEGTYELEMVRVAVQLPSESDRYTQDLLALCPLAFFNREAFDELRRQLVEAHRTGLYRSLVAGIHSAKKDMKVVYGYLYGTSSRQTVLLIEFNK